MKLRDVPDVGLSVFGTGTREADALDDGEFEVVVVEVGVADHLRERTDLIVKLGHGVAALEAEAERVQVLLGVLEHLEHQRRSDNEGRGCGAVGRAVPSNARDPQIEPPSLAKLSFNSLSTVFKFRNGKINE